MEGKQMAMAARESHVPYIKQVISNFSRKIRQPAKYTGCAAHTRIVHDWEGTQNASSTKN